MSFLCSPLKIRNLLHLGLYLPITKICRVKMPLPATLLFPWRWGWALAAIHHHTWAAVFLVEARGEWNIPCTHFSAGNVKIKEWSRRPQASRKMRRTIFLCGSKDDFFFLCLNNFTHFCCFSKSRVHGRCQLCSTDSQHLVEGILGVTLDRLLHLHHIQNGTDFISKQGKT